MLMKTVLFDGMEFTGPYYQDEGKIPSVRAYALVIVEGGEGQKVLTFLHSDNIATEVSSSKWKECWERNRNRERVQVYITETSDEHDVRDARKRDFLDRRLRFMPCDELPPMEDDF